MKTFYIKMIKRKKVRIVLKDAYKIEKLEGFLISEDKDTIILKLDNGYNIGIKKEEISSIEILKEEEFKKEEGKKEKIAGKVSIIATGGTILSKVDYTTGAVSSLMSSDEILEVFPELEELGGIKEIKAPFSILSENMTPKEWIEIAENTYELLKDSEGVIIFHGTDTMHFTSAALSFMLRNLTKPVCLTGAQRSSDRPSSDAFVNLKCSFIYATSDIAEVSIVFHGSISDEFCYAHRGTRVRKMHTERRDTFVSINDKPLVKIYPSGKIEAINNYSKRKKEFDTYLDKKLNAKVALVKFYPGEDPEIIDFFVDKKYKGIVIEGTGFGHVALDPRDKKYSWEEHLKRAIEEGVILCMTSQTIFGRVNPYVYSTARKLKDMGIIYCEDMLPEVAYVKLMWVLGHTENYEEVKRLMLTPLAKEIKERSLYEEFFTYSFNE